MNQFQRLSVQAALMVDKMLDEQDGAEVCLVLATAAEVARRTVTDEGTVARDRLDAAVKEHLEASRHAFEAMEQEERPS